jgi:hypothetical protein
LASAQNDPAWWLNLLEKRQLMRRFDMQKMEQFYRGHHPMPFLTDAHEGKMRDEFQQMLDESQSNFMRLVVDVVGERLAVEGFSVDGGEDDAVEEIWRANHLDSASRVAFTEAMVKGVSYLSVWDDADGDGSPDIRVEDPLETIVAYVPGTGMRQRAAAAKFWLDDLTGDSRANVHLPDRIVRYRGAGSILAPATTVTAANALDAAATSSRWEMLAEDGEVPNPLGVVNIVPLRNRPRLLLEGESELSDVWRIQMQINGFLFLLALAGYFGAHKQRWAVGLTLHEDVNGKPVEPFDVAIDRLIFDENPGARFGEFAQTDLGGYVKAIEQKVLHIAVTTRTPRHYLIESGQSPSGDAIRSAESGLVKKVLGKQDSYGDGIGEAMQLASRLAGNKDAPRPETVWTPPQTDVEAAITDAVLKQLGANLIDQRTALTKLGYSKGEATNIITTTANDNVPVAPPAPPAPADPAAPPASPPAS